MRTTLPFEAWNSRPPAGVGWPTKVREGVGAWPPPANPPGPGRGPPGPPGEPRWKFPGGPAWGVPWPGGRWKFAPGGWEPPSFDGRWDVSPGGRAPPSLGGRWKFVAGGREPPPWLDGRWGVSPGARAPPSLGGRWKFVAGGREPPSFGGRWTFCAGARCGSWARWGCAGAALCGGGCSCRLSFSSWPANVSAEHITPKASNSATARHTGLATPVFELFKSSLLHRHTKHEHKP